MRITKKEDYRDDKNQVSTKSWTVSFEDDSQVIDIGDDRVLVIEGELYYLRHTDGKIDIIKNIKSRSEIELIRTMCSKNWLNLTNTIEGRYVAAVLDKKNDSVLVTNDTFARVNVFYYEGGIPIASTKIEDILSLIKKIEYQQEVLYCILTVGYAPAKHTPYQSIRRLAYSEQLVFKSGKKTVIHPKLGEIKIRPMGDKDLETYAEIFKNAILSRASDIENWVLISGGWDSTVMLATLCKHMDKSKIKPIVAKLLLPDGRCYNPYEVSKSQKISAYYGLKCDVVDTWMSDENTYDYISSISPNLRSYLLFDWMSAFYEMSKRICEKGKKGAAVFCGHLSDGLHNFGFAQFSSLPYLTYDFREYSDKMRCYLYSPSFLKKVLNSSYERDFIFRLFWWHAGSGQDLIGSKKQDKVLDYLLSFVVSDFRIPFARVAREAIFKEEGKKAFKNWLYDSYFKEATEKIRPENMYFYLINLYKLFHLQGSHYLIMQSSFEGTGFHPRLPYMDIQLAEFLSQMPENWGRGLEWKPIKYPLKQYAKEFLDIPVDIIELDFHSYIDEKEDKDRMIDWRAEMVNNSSLGLVWRDSKKQRIVDKVFDPRWFNINLIKEYLSNPCDASNSKLLLNLVTFLSVGLEDM